VNTHLFFYHLYFQHKRVSTVYEFTALLISDSVFSFELLAQCAIHLGPLVIFIVMFEKL